MKKRTHCYIVLLAIGCLFCLSMRPPISNNDTLRVRILDGSKVFLKGSTNVNKFRCDCIDRLSGVRSIERAADTPTGRASYQATSLDVAAFSLDCGNEKMNRDLYAALRASEYPNISIRLLESWPVTVAGQRTDGWIDARARALLTITSTTREIEARCKIKRLAEGTYELLGEKTINMSDYGVVPPQAMFGMIKVNDHITLNFRLKIQIEN